MQSVAALFAQHVRRDGLRFAEADADGDNVLTFDEFLSMQPKTVRQEHSEEEVRAWFDAVDLDGSGTLSVNEFFLWTLQKEAMKDMKGMRAIFQSHDKNSSGCLDMGEFQRVCDELGFGAVAHDSVKEGFQRRPGVGTLRVRWWCPVESTTVRVASVVLYQCSYVLVHVL